MFINVLCFVILDMDLFKYFNSICFIIHYFILEFEIIDYSVVEYI